MQEFFTEVQSASLPGIWSKGIKLARAGAVLLEEASDGESVFRVKTPGRVVAPVCVLYLHDNEWSCDCGSQFDPCEHIVASTIAAKEAALKGEAVLQSREVQAGLGYRLKRASGPSLIIERVVVTPDGEETILAEPLTRMIAAHRCPVEPTHEDLMIEPLLVKAGVGRDRASISQGLSPEGMHKLLRVLATAHDVRLDGKKIQVELKQLMPRAVVENHEDGVLLRVEGPVGVDELLDRGVVLSAGKLRPLGAVDLVGSRLERLPLRRSVGPKELGILVAEILPGIERHVAVEVRTDRLPNRGGALRPRLHFDMSPKGHTLSVLSTLVYGTPPQIRIDGGEMVHLAGDVPKRDIPAEKRIVKRLRDELNMIPGRSVHYDGLEAGRFAKRLQEFQTGVRGGQESSFSSNILVDKPLHAEITLEGDSFNLTFRTQDDEERQATVENVYRAWRDGLDLVPLEDGGWAPLPHDWLARFGHRVADVLAARRKDGKVPAYAAGRLAEVCGELGVPAPPSFDRLKPLLDDFSGLPRAELPKAMSATLRGYQQEGVDWLTFLRTAGLGAVLADDMGLGKTLQTLCALKRRTLVVCPRSVVFNWAREAERFRPDLNVAIYHGPKRELTDARITITTYSVLRLDIEKLSQQDWDTIVLDEAQAIKSPESQVSRAAFSLTDSAAEATFRVALSGTPVENRLDELWSLFRFTHPGLLGQRPDFEQRYIRPIAAGDNQAADSLRRLIKPFLLRRLKKDVAKDLPPRTDTVLSVELTEKERELYDAVYAAKHKDVVHALEAGGGVMAALEALLRLRQAACHGALVPGQQAESSSKVEALLDAVTDAVSEDHKCIIFSQWTSFLDLVEPELKSRDIAFVRLDGTTRDRSAVVTQFQDPDGPPIILSSLKAGGTGLNLTAADHVFLLDPWWNPAAEDQAADRAHRIGQTRPVTVYRLIAKDTIEEGILKLQERKRSLADIALAEGGAAAGVSRDDLLELLSSPQRASGAE